MCFATLLLLENLETGLVIGGGLFYADGYTSLQSPRERSERVPRFSIDRSLNSNMGFNPIMSTPPSWPHLYLTSFQSSTPNTTTLTPNALTWGRGNKRQSITNRVTRHCFCFIYSVTLCRMLPKYSVLQVLVPTCEVNTTVPSLWRLKNTSQQRLDQFPVTIQWVCVVAGRLALKTLCRCLYSSASGKHPGKGVVLPHFAPPSLKCGISDAHLGPLVNANKRTGCGMD